MGYHLKLFSEEDQTSFNPKLPQLCHIDLNCCFASIEQQANPLFRGKPLVVTPTMSRSGCVISPSREAKALGIKTGTRNWEALKVCPNLIILHADPDKYRFVHLKLKKLLQDYSNTVLPKSIDEFIVDFSDYPNVYPKLHQIGQEIKERIKAEIGEVLTVSIGIGPNRFLAKTAAGIKKPDGLEEINFDNHLEVFSNLKLTDLPGINIRNQRRLNLAGIQTVPELATRSLNQLTQAFHSVEGLYWYLKLRGWEIEETERARRSYGNSCVIGQPLQNQNQVLAVIQKLTEKMGYRLRRGGAQAQGVHLSLVYADHSYWHKGRKVERYLFDSQDLYQELTRLLQDQPSFRPVKKVAVTAFDLEFAKGYQLELFSDTAKQVKRVKAVDQINSYYGHFTLTPTRMLPFKDQEVVVDRIAFGGVKELEELSLDDGGA